MTRHLADGSLGGPSVPEEAPPAAGHGAHGVRRWLGDNVVDNLLDFAFPSRCAGCGRFYADLCAECSAALEPIREPYCPRCGRPDVQTTLTGWCEECVGREQSFVQARSAFVYEGVARALVAAVKFERRRRLVELLAGLAYPAFVEFMQRHEAPVVTWVPAHRAAKRRRGFNLAEDLAGSLVAQVPQPHTPRLVRLVRKTRSTAHQQALGKDERIHNLEEAFAPVDTERPQTPQRNVIVVDDVFTTGSTAEAVSRALGARWKVPVYVFTFARAVSTGRIHLD